MGEIRRPAAVMPLLAACSCDDGALLWSELRAKERWGDIIAVSPRFDFVETDYYYASMGKPLYKCFWAFGDLIDPGQLAALKRETNAWEMEYAGCTDIEVARPLNLDPGYITLGKLVLASTKDHAHRVYAGDGIFAEVTLRFRKGSWEAFEWTYPDYRRADYWKFFDTVREALRKHPQQS